MRALRLAPVLLLALAACTVDTDSLKPKTDAECAATGLKACGPRCVAMSERCGRELTSADCPLPTKACGNACVSLNDPAVGCSSAGCTPCPSGPLGEPAICAAGSCTYSAGSCPGTLTRCGGVCEDLGTSKSHCGACDHACAGGASCTGGLCWPSQVVQASPTTSPRDVTCNESGWVAFLDVNTNAWVTPNAASPASIFAVPQYAGPFGVSPRISSGLGLSSRPVLYLAGRDQGGGGGAIWEYDSSSGGNVWIYGSALEAYSSLAVSDAWVYFTQRDSLPSRVNWVGRSPNNSSGGRDFAGSQGVGPITGVATAYVGATGTWHAFAIAGNAIIHLEEVGSLPRTATGLPLLAESADRIAATTTAAGTFRLYLGDSTTGRIWRFDEHDAAPTLIATAAFPGGHFELVADASGAYWTLGSARLVMEYRASDGAVFPLADWTTTGQPWSLCVGPWSGYVSWSDTSMNDVRAVPR